VRLASKTGKVKERRKTLMLTYHLDRLAIYGFLFFILSNGFFDMRGDTIKNNCMIVTSGTLIEDPPQA